MRSTWTMWSIGSQLQCSVWTALKQHALTAPRHFLDLVVCGLLCIQVLIILCSIVSCTSLLSCPSTGKGHLQLLGRIEATYESVRCLVSSLWMQKRMKSIALESTMVQGNWRTGILHWVDWIVALGFTSHRWHISASTPEQHMLFWAHHHPSSCLLSFCTAIKYSQVFVLFHQILIPCLVYFYSYYYPCWKAPSTFHVLILLSAFTIFMSNLSFLM